MLGAWIQDLYHGFVSPWLCGQEIPPLVEQAQRALAVHHKAEIDKWWPLMKAAGIKGE